MAYNFTKLSDATLVDFIESTPNILIEDGGDIKRISADDLATPQVNADWNETDATSPAFIMNKPESLGGSGANVITYTGSSGSYYLDSARVTPQDMLDAWNSGAIMRLNNGDGRSQILSLYYYDTSGSPNLSITYAMGSALYEETIW